MLTYLISTAELTSHVQLFDIHVTDTSQRQDIRAAMDHWELETCIRFVLHPYSGQNNPYIYITKIENDGYVELLIRN